LGLFGEYNAALDGLVLALGFIWRVQCCFRWTCTNVRKG